MTRAAPSCLTFDPVTAISSPLLKPTPISSRKDFGHRYTSTGSVPFFTSKWTISFSLPFEGNFTSSTVPFIFVSVCGSYLGALASFPCAFCAITGSRQKSARNAARKSSFLEKFGRRDSREARIAPPSKEPPEPRPVERKSQWRDFRFPISPYGWGRVKPARSRQGRFRGQPDTVPLQLHPRQRKR